MFSTYKHLFLKLNILKYKFSFGLVETAVAVGIIGTMAGISLSAYNASNPQYKRDVEKINKIQDALQKFFSTNGRLPAPARAEDYKGSTYYLREYYSTTLTDRPSYMSSRYSITSFSATAKNTSPETPMTTTSTNEGQNNSGVWPTNVVLWGVVPTRTLGLPDDYAYDSHGHNFEYITHHMLTTKLGTGYRGDTYKKQSYVSQNNTGTYKIYLESQNKENFYDMYYPLKILSIYDATQPTPTEIDGTNDNTAYVIISKGNSKNCFWSNEASALLSETTVPTDNTKYNCFANVANNFTALTIYKGYSRGQFDNIVAYKTLTDLVHKRASVKSQTDAMSESEQTTYQTRMDNTLSTISKNIVDAINELLPRTNVTDSTSKLYLMGSTTQVNSTAQSNTNQYVYMQNGELYVDAKTTYGATNNSSVKLKTAICEISYPVGSIFMTTDTTLNTSTNVTTKLGCGSWEQIQGRVLIGAGSGTDTNSTTQTFAVNTTGGEYTHKLVATEIPPHRHWISDGAWDDGNSSSAGQSNAQSKGLMSDAGTYQSYDTGSTYGRYDSWAGGATYGASGKSSNDTNLDDANKHNNIQPYLAVYIWKRIS